MDSGLPERLFTPAVFEELKTAVDLQPTLLTKANAAEYPLEDVELIIGCWGCPQLDEAMLDRMPRLKAVIYTAGSVKEFATEELFSRDITVTSGADTNALPVAEYTLAMILLSGKRILEIADGYVRSRKYRPFAVEPARWGNYGLKVGVVGASRIGRRVIELLNPFDVDVVFYDPFVPEDILNARSVNLDELLRESDVVSLHAPEVPATFQMINKDALALMRDGSTLINTARGSLVDTAALTAELASGRLHAVIDVTDPDPLPADSALFNAPNLVLTPHIAGSQGNELHRLGEAAFRDVERFIAGQPLLNQVKAEVLSHTA
ncbi:hydroxyacid dehydrogenase [Pseudarthrobacter sp. J75]|uniref:hydroxyacid dehydrogenase n=1 Tax=unclassified Pseudarthrobacter TaxID=2647000 RepID=UPI002E822F80|nr:MULTISPECIES: hydroxyacid dehydrogenase [unclassified Pseudarthrobacter]MEE2523146.1 hydroxyacid dehydrogenase [Pseudarthrobacter sp. J47]MEE2529830.1 hydroxyacid dehydrogenase [Pseudarthrobacter sp. J75]